MREFNASRLNEYELAIAKEAVDHFRRKTDRLEAVRRLMSTPVGEARTITATAIDEWAHRVELRLDKQLRFDTEAQWFEMGAGFLTLAGDHVATREMVRQLAPLFAWHFYGVKNVPRDFIVIGNVIGVDGEGIVDTLEFRSFKPSVPYQAERAALGLPATPAPARPRSSGAVGQVWSICDANPGLANGALVKLCTDAGINLNTAKTQVYQWRKAHPKNAP